MTITIERTGYDFDSLLTTAVPAAYVQRLLEGGVTDHGRALGRFSPAQVHAVVEALGTHPLSQRVEPADAVLMALTALDGAQERWGVSDEDWEALFSLSDQEGRAFALLVKALRALAEHPEAR